MSVLEEIIEAVDKLNHDDRTTLYQYLRHKRQTEWWSVSSDNLKRIDDALSPVQQEAESMTDDEINAVIDEAIDEVRRERRED